MEKQRDYTQDLADIRSMMERSTKFMSLSGLAGAMAGLYALAGTWIAWHFFGFNPDSLTSEGLIPVLPEVTALAVLVLLLSIGTAVALSKRKARKSGENVWNAPTRLMIKNMALPLAAGGFFILVLISKGLIGLLAPSTLLFYGLALYNAGKFTYDDVKGLGLIQMALGLAGTWYIEYGLLLWALGFGVVHIAYGLYMHYKYER